jgi:excinuclease ABC subunit A
MDKIKIIGAREHNLKNISLEIPRDKLVVLTGISGSGKSSLAFDTIYAEGQRRYVESLSSYARQFLGVMEKPDVDYIEGLSPAISIDQKATSHNPRSSVGTVTEIYDYLRLLYARIGIPHCPNCGKLIKGQTPTQIIDQIYSQKPKSEFSMRQTTEHHVQNSSFRSSEGAKEDQKDQKKIIILAPLISDQKGEHINTFEKIKKAGFARVRVDGIVFELSEVPKLDKQKKHSIEVVVDRLLMSQTLERSRLADSIETALNLGSGIIKIQDTKNKSEQVFSEHFSCPDCSISLPEIQPRIFSFNSPHGACTTCQGLGVKLEIDPDLVIPNKRLTLAEGAIRPWTRTNAHSTWYLRILEAVGKEHHFSINAPVEKLSKETLDMILNGTGNQQYLASGHTGKVQQYLTTFEGVIPSLSRRYRETDSEFIRSEINKYMVEKICPACHGKRLKPEVLAITIDSKSIIDLTRLAINRTVDFFNQLSGKLNDKEQQIAKQILKEIRERLKFLVDVGLDYLTLDRNASTLAGGEAQRIRLATQIGSGLMGVIYILDEPSIGLHQRDNHKLLETLKNLRDLGNSIIVVEHDRDTMLAADFLVDIGPGAGERGGEIIAQGTPADIMENKNSLTGLYLKNIKKIPQPAERRISHNGFLKIVKASEYNLKNIDVKIPLGLFVCVTGVSGSGKSTLVTEILAKALSSYFYHARIAPGAHERIEGVQEIHKVIDINQSPIGRTPRSNPATYTNVFGPIRELFANTQEARLRGYLPGRFSFNVRGGRCETCRGEGQIKIEMHFLPDIWITCDECKGKRYNKEALEIHYKEKTIADILDMNVDEALKFFVNIPNVSNKLQILHDVGLGYIKLGQPAPTLSGGDAQRVKLAPELAARAPGKTLYILDEPTTGLHFEDIKKLLQVLNRLVDMGHTVLVIEHNMDVIKCADWIIDLGPEGGEKGGYLVAEGPPEEIIKNKKSYTGEYLKKVL